MSIWFANHVGTVAATLVCAGTAIFAAACQEAEPDPSNTADGATGNESSGGARGAATGSAGTSGGAQDPGDPSPQYVVSTAVFSPEGVTGYILALDALSSRDQGFLASGLEVPGRALVVGRERAGEFFVLGEMAPEITKWTLSAAGQLERGATLSFMGRGVTSLLGTPVRIISESEAIVVDPASGQLIRWNPGTMEIIGVIDLGEALLHEGVPPLSDAPDPYVPGFSEVGGKLAMTFYYFPNDTRIPSQSVMVLYDPTSRAATVIKDDRCSVSKAAPGPDGHLYVGSNDYVAALHRLDEGSAPAPCLLRVRSDTFEFDPSYYVALNSLNGNPTMGLLAGPDGVMYVRSLDESQFPVAPDATYPELVATAGWSTWRLTNFEDGSPAVDELEALGYGASRISFAVVDGRVLFARFAADFSATDWFDLTSETPAAIEFTVPGANVSLLRVR